MKLDKATFAHITDGFKVYLDAEDQPHLTQYKDRVRTVYGSLEGVTFIKLPPGTELSYVGRPWHHYTLPLLHGHYVGGNPHFYGCTAMIKLKGDNMVEAQFDKCAAYEPMCYGWHTFLTTDWEIT